MRPGFRRWIVVGFALTAGVLAFNTIISIRNIRRLAENNRSALRAAETLSDLETTLSTVKDAETGQRGYLLTGREAYLAPYLGAVESLDGELRRLEGLLDDPTQRARLGVLDSRVREKLDELKQTLDLRRSRGPAAAAEVVLSDRGRRAMIDLSRVVLAMEQTERNLLARRIAESEEALGWATTTFAVASLTAGAMVVALGVVVAGHLASRQRSERALRDQIERWRVTLASIGDAVIVTDAGSRITFLNPRAESLCGPAGAGAGGRPLAEVFRPIDERTGLPAQDPIAAVLRDGNVVGLADHVVLADDGGPGRPIHAIAAPIRDDRGQIAGAVLVFRDDTERRHRERELVEANRRKDEFLAMLAHELRNPLAAIRSAVESIGEAGAGGRDAWAEGVVARQVEHLSRLLDDLLDVARITRGLIRVRRQPIDLGPVIGRAVESVRPMIDERRHRLEVAIAPGPMRLEADPTRLEQVLVNLLTNAARYTPPGGHIRLVAAREGDEIVLRVADDGMGIAPELLPRVFDLFAQGDRTLARSEGGLGIGLTVVRKLVELHEGSVAARSAGPAQGSEFVVRLPAIEAPADATAASPTPTAEVPDAGGRRSRVLIVDDNRDLARGMARLLKILGHEAEVAYDGPDGIEAARKYRPDVILLDIGLPRLDGYFVARALRQEGFRDTLIIAISGYGQEEDRRRSLEAGMNHHLTKPVDIKTISALIAQPA